MPRFIKAILSSFSAAAFMLFPLLNTGSKSDLVKFQSLFLFNNSIKKNSFDPQMELIYDSLHLKKMGLKKEAFNYAYTGYKKLEEEGKLDKEGLITICDFSQSSKRKRLYLIDLNEYKVLLNTYVAHGKNSGGEYAKKFSNRPESRQSSLGFYRTETTYYGGHGLALTLSGLEPGFNDKAEGRKIVLHGSLYIGDNYKRWGKYMGRSFGCPAVPMKQSKILINTIKEGSCLFIYHPSKNYLSGSKILNG
ncbi:MAG TPA: murein L,D-transpeptidase catalytic domain family protein [Chitinophagaceae bacterium]|nr:murein L,D-transpeptidase catalytic domain family protein [Chitinophagaceae bacterium]